MFTSENPRNFMIPTQEVTKFRIAAKRFFLTYPQCPLEAEIAVNQIVRKGFLKPKVVIFGRELHQDGNSHLHGYVEYPRKLNVTRPDYFDLQLNQLIGRPLVFHGNYQATRSAKRTVRYVVKGGAYFLTGISEEQLRAMIKPGGGEELAVKLLEVERIGDYHQVQREMPVFFSRHYKMIREYLSVLRINRQRDMIVPLRRSFQLDEPEGLDQVEARLYNWLQGNLNGEDRKRRTPQLFIVSPTGFGKTELVCRLSRHFSVYPIPNGEEFYDQWEDESYDLAVLDEFYGQKKVTWMNQWLEGSIMTLRKKGAQYVKRKNVATIVLSNQSLEECYWQVLGRRPAVFKALSKRVLELKLERKLHVFIDKVFPEPPQARSNRPASPTSPDVSPELLSPLPPQQPVVLAPEFTSLRLSDSL